MDQLPKEAAQEGAAALETAVVQETTHGREVYIVMMPLKDVGQARKYLVKLLLQCLGSIVAMGWCTHWVILFGDTCFELQRFPTRPFTRLRASHWDKSRSADVLQQMFCGHSSWSDTEIEDLGNTYFQRYPNIPYDLYMNNCQTFVTHLANTICSNDLPEDRHISIPLHHILSYSAARIYIIFTVPIFSFWLRCRGCHSDILTEYNRMSAFWGYWLLPIAIQQAIAFFPAMITQLREGLKENPDNKLPIEMRYITVIMTSFWLFGFTVVQVILVVWVSIPIVKKYSDGKWRLQSRPLKVPLMDMRGVSKFEDMGQEDPMPGDSDEIVTEDGRFPDPQKLVLPPWIWVVSGVSGFILAVLYWSYRLSRRLVLWTVKKLRQTLSYN